MKSITEKPAPRSKKTTPAESASSNSMSAKEIAVRRKRKTTSYTLEELKKRRTPCGKCGYGISLDETYEESGGPTGIFIMDKECPHCGEFFIVSGPYEYLDEQPRKDPVTGEIIAPRKILWPTKFFSLPKKPASNDAVAWEIISERCLGRSRSRS